jgi:uncharacterized membrane protein YcfT
MTILSAHASPAMHDAEVSVPPRNRGLDALRGLAVLLMVLDHAALVFDLPAELRTTLGRCAMPLFFVLGGHLARRLSWRRYAELVVVGTLLQGLVPWSGAGPLLLCFVLGHVVVVTLRRHQLVLALLVGFGLTLGANGYAYLHAGGTAYDPRLLVALMAFGALLPRELLSLLDRLPARAARPLALVGRYPLSVYAGHLALLQLFLIGTS